MILNENIKKFRRESGLTQKALATRSGLSFSMISKLESGEQSNPSFETIRKIADVLRISPGNLVSEPPTIEEQIDEYILYKRGLEQNLAGSVQSPKSKAAGKEDQCGDLNFKKKLQAINTFPAPSEEAPREHSDYPDNRPEMLRLVFALQHATKDEINQVTRLVETFKGIIRLP